MSFSDHAWPGAIDLSPRPGIGQATVLAFVRAGCTRLCLVDLNAKGLEETRRQITEINPDVKVNLAAGNITKVDFVEGFVNATVEKFGRLDYGVNAAGTIGPWANSQELKLEDHDRVMDVNYRGTFLCARAEVRAMLKNEPSGPDDIPGQRGAIVHIASGLASVGRQGAREYSGPPDLCVPPCLNMLTEDCDSRILRLERCRRATCTS